MRRIHKRAHDMPGLYFRPAAAASSSSGGQGTSSSGSSNALQSTTAASHSGASSHPSALAGDEEQPMELAVPKFRFDPPRRWEDVGTSMWLATGTNLEDKRSVIAKVAPAGTAAGLVLERELHVLGKLSDSLEASERAMRLIDFYIVPPAQGDVFVLLLQHPGPNALPAYYPSSYAPSFLCPATLPHGERGSNDDDSVGGMAPRERSETSAAVGTGMEDGGPGGTFDGPQEDRTPMPSPAEEVAPDDEVKDLTEIDLASFLEFAVQATQCVESLHAHGLTHGELRPNAFHLSASTGTVKLSHTGNRSVPLDALTGEFYKGQSQLIRESIAYLAPEQTGLVGRPVDHRTDLYSLGATFFALLTGQVPWGYTTEVLQAIVSRKPRKVHELRPDIPPILSAIVDKLASKNPDDRYLTAAGLGHDIQQCQFRLTDGRQHDASSSSELLPAFLLGSMDRFSTFRMPASVYGRERELEAIRAVLQRVASVHLQHYQPRRPALSSPVSSTDSVVAPGTLTSSFGQQTPNFEQVSDGGSSSRASQTGSTTGELPQLVPSDRDATNGTSSTRSLRTSSFASSAGIGPAGRSLTRKPVRERGAATRVVVVSGPMGTGKSALVAECQSDFRKAGYFGTARFEATPSAPYSTILSAMSGVFRQLLDSRGEVNTFWEASKERLGSCLRNVQLLYQNVPELREICDLFGVAMCPTDVEVLATAEEARARFLALVLDVITVLAQQKMVTFVLDDLQCADEASLSLLRSLATAKLRLLIVVTVKTESLSMSDDTFGHNSRTTYIPISALAPEAITAFISDTLHDTVEHVAPLSQALYRHSHGNVFLVKDLLQSMVKHNHIFFDWQQNVWRFNIETIENQFFPELAERSTAELCDDDFLRAQLADLPKEVSRFLAVASQFGASFRQQDVCALLDADESSGSDGSSSEEMMPDPVKLSRTSMAASQSAISEGWITARGRGFYAFAHERYRRAAESLLAKTTETDRAQMSLKIVDILLNYPSTSTFQAASLLLKCESLLLSSPPVDPTYRECMYAAGQDALRQGAHETALEFLAVAEKMGAASGTWQTAERDMFDLNLSLVGLELFNKQWEASSRRIKDLYEKADTPSSTARVMLRDARQKWVENDPAGHFDLLLQGLDVLGFGVPQTASDEERDLAYAAVKSMLSLQGDTVVDLKPVTDEGVLLASDLLAEAAVAAFWAQEGGVDTIAFKLVQLVLTQGMTPSACMGFVWLGVAASNTYGDIAFGAQMSNLSMTLARLPVTQLGPKGRTYTLHSCMAPYASPLKEARPVFSEATRLSWSAGDTTFAVFSRLHQLASALTENTHLADSVVLADEVVADIRRWQPATAANDMSVGTANVIKALHGQTVNVTPLTVMNTEDWVEERDLPPQSTSVEVQLAWYHSFKIIALYSLGWTEDAASLGFYLWANRDWSVNHLHVRRAAYYHSLALVDQLRRRPDFPPETRTRYLDQIVLNQAYIEQWASFAPANFQHWTLLVSAEVASLQGDASAFALYDRATQLARDNGWTSDLAWCYYLSGMHLVQSGAVGLGTELQQRAVATHNQWGATAVADYLSLQFEHVHSPRHVSVDCAVQTDASHHDFDEPAVDDLEDDDADQEYKDLSLSDVQAIIRGSLTIGSNVHLGATLEALTELVVRNSNAEQANIIIRNEDNQHIIATSCVRGEACVVFESPPQLVDAEDANLLKIASHVIASHEKVLLSDAAKDPRFADLPGSRLRSVACLPISLRGRSIGCIYLSSSRVREFSPNNMEVLSILASQACIALNNAMLFKKLQRTTQANLKGLAAQRQALAEARASREEAIKASRIKSNFLASMSHELRTPFSSFFGLLGLLAETPLDPEQQDFVQTARSSCELLLDIIDSLLDYSKLEAGALKLAYATVSTEDVAADCLELLIPTAVGKGLELSYKIDPDVPLLVQSDSSRVRQILMNLTGNSVKFTAMGSVSLSVALSAPGALELKEDEIALRCEVKDTGIGMSADEISLLFRPFVQLDGGTTRRYGGSGLGLSICLQLVRLFGGKIGVDSAPGEGSKFWFDIPVRRSEAQDAKARKDLHKLQAQLNTPSPLSILVFSPSPTTMAYIAVTISGARITTASTVSELVARLIGPEAARVDLFILDCQNAAALTAVKQHALAPRILRLVAPSTEALKSRAEIGDGVTVLYHPVRRRRLLELACSLTARIPVTEETQGPPGAALSVRGPAKTIDLFTPQERDVLAKSRILVAEDNNVMRRLLIKVLEKVGLKVEAAVDGTAAVEEWAARPDGYFSLALFDHHMPGATGPDAAGRIRLLESRQGRRSRLPIVGLSADVQPTARALCLSNGMDDYLSKPLRQQDLLRLVRMFIAPPPSAPSSPSPLPSPALAAPLRPPSLISATSSSSTVSYRSAFSRPAGFGGDGGDGAGGEAGARAGTGSEEGVGISNPRTPGDNQALLPSPQVAPANIPPAAVELSKDLSS